MAKHILLSTDDPGTGGVAQYNHSLLCGLATLGYHVTCLQNVPAYRDRFIEAQSQLGIQHLFVDAKSGEEWQQVLTNLSHPVDLIICSNSNPFSNFIVKHFAINLLDVPYIVIEGLVEPHFADRYAAYLDELSYHYSRAKAVIAVSQDNLDLLRQFFKLPEHQGQVIYYGRPPEYFTAPDASVRDRLRQTVGIPADAVVCFTAARLEPRKGYQYQLEAIYHLIQQPVWSQLYFVWAGEGVWRSQLEAAIQQLGVTEKVTLLGKIDTVAEWLDAADIFVFPSQLEGMPLGVMEAMAKGLPVVATAVSGIPEELGNTGKLLPDPKQDPQAMVGELVATLQAWALNPELRHAIGQAGKQRAVQLFQENRMVKETVDIIEPILSATVARDYISPGLATIYPDLAFPNMGIGDTTTCGWQYLRREIPHKWYVDRRQPTIGFLSRDEAHILYNNALQFKGKRALEIGCWLGWSACHLALAGVELDVIDPVLAQPGAYDSVSHSLNAAGVLPLVNLVAGYSPQQVQELASQHQRRWSLIFIDGNHEAPGPLQDAIACEPLAEADAMILFHDLASPDVAQGLDYFRQKGWNTLVYQTMQIMGVAWRGMVKPVEHQADPNVDWQLPTHLHAYRVSGRSLPQQEVSAEANAMQSVAPTPPVISQTNRVRDSGAHEFNELLNAVRPYTLLSDARLFSLYSLAKKVCLDDVPGNFVECGTYKGGSAALLAAVIQRYSQRPRLLYAFDTFTGMPTPTEADRHRGIPANLTGFGEGTLAAPMRENLEQVCQSLQVTDIVLPIQGLFAQTLPQQQPRIGSIALLHADGDWYESTVQILNTLYENVVQDGMIQIDDYGHWEGCKKAVHEFERHQNMLFVLRPIDDTGVWFCKHEAIALRKVEKAMVLS